MSGGRQHRTWATYPKNRELIEKVRRAHFHHFSDTGGGLTYQSCRFCGEACFRNEDKGHGAECWFIKNTGTVCRGLWKCAGSRGSERPHRPWGCGPCG